MTATDPTSTRSAGITRRAWTVAAKAFLFVAMVLIIAMWVYGLFFASKEAINKIYDREWAARAQAICERAEVERLALTDLRRLDDVGPDALAGRAAIVDRATDILSRMLDEVVAVQPTDAKGQELIPMWEGEYRVYLQDRRDYTDLLRAGINRPFAETQSDGLPLSERLETFAGDNEMPECAPPRDLTT